MASPVRSSQVTHVSASQYSPRERSQDPAVNLLSTQYEGVFRSALRKDLADKLAGRPTRTKPTPPRPLILPSTAPGSNLVDPEDPLSDPWRETLWYAFQNYGRIGIEWAIYEQAKQETPNAHWAKILAAKNSTVLTLTLTRIQFHGRRTQDLQGSNFPEVQQLELFPLWSDDQGHAQMGEILGSLLGSSYSRYGGLNPVWAGTTSMHAENRDPAKFDAQAVNLVERIEKAEYPEVEHDRFDTLMRGLKAAKELRANKAKSEEAARKYEEAKIRHQQAMVKWEAQHKEIGNLRKRLAEAEERQRQASQEPWMHEFHKLTLPFEEEEVVHRFTRMNLRHMPDAHKIAMDAQGIPESIQAKVEARRLANKAEATARLESIFGFAPAIQRPARRSPPRASEVVEILSDMEGLNLGAMSPAEGSGQEDQTEWGLPGFTDS